MLMAVGLAVSATSLPSCPALAQDKASGDLQIRRSLCQRSIALSGLEQDMDANIRSVIEDSFQTLSAAYPDDTRTVTAYKDSLSEAMTAAKAPVLAKLQESCAAAFSAEELRGINAFYESAAGRAWLEKGKTLMVPALDKAIRDVTPEVIVNAQKRFCARMGGCSTPSSPQPGTVTS
ncbi:DUF2059 domain-containing protein [Sphingomonas oryzagri]